MTWGPFLERPGSGNLPGPESDFDIKVSRKVGRVLASDEVHFDSALLHNFQIFSLTGPVITGTLEKRAPGARFSKLAVITGPVKLFCFPLRMEVSKVLKMVQLSY